MSFNSLFKVPEVTTCCWMSVPHAEHQKCITGIFGSIALGVFPVPVRLLTSSLLEQLKWSSAVLTILAAVVVAFARELEKQLTMGCLKGTDVA